MRHRLRLIALAFSLAMAGSTFAAPAEAMLIFDKARDRSIPVLIYPADQASGKPLVILSHGKGIKNSEYSFLASGLAERGYVVASIQHDLPGDPPTPNTGNIPKDRTPGWRSQVQSILYVADTLAQSPKFSFKGKPVLIGHSNGGDASMMAARDFPDKFSVVMSLDNRRFALPRTSKPRICSIRSSDQKPDPGVLPMKNEAAEFDIRLSFANGIRHDDMWDGATNSQKAQMLDAVWACLKP